MRILITGGIRSGKSSVEQALIAQFTKRCPAARPLVIVFGKPGVDEEFDHRIALHRSARPDDWLTLELGEHPHSEWLNMIEQATAEGETVIGIECIGTMVSTLIDVIALQKLGERWYEHVTIPSDVADDIEEQILQVAQSLLGVGHHQVIVTNEVGSAPIAPTPSGRLFVDIMGRLNQYLVASCDKAYLCTMGLCLDMKEQSVKPTWE